MVETVTSSALRTLVKAQTSSPQNSLSALKSNPSARKAILAPFQEESATTNTGALTLSSAGQSGLPGNLPRGSLVNLLV